MFSPISVFAIIYLPLLISCESGLKNVNNLQQFIAIEKIEAEFYTSGSYFQLYDDCTEDSSMVYLGDFSTATVLEYEQMDYGYGVERVSLRVANIDPRGALNISLHVSSASSTPFVTVPVNPTGSDKCAFVTVDIALQTVPAGKQNLFITFPSGDGGQLFLDWFQFNDTSGGVIPVTERIQAEDFDYAEDMEVSYSCPDVAIMGNDGENVAEYYSVDFGIGVQSVSVRSYLPIGGNVWTVSFYTSGHVQFAYVNFEYAGGNCQFTEKKVNITASPTGVQNLFVSLTAPFYIYLDSFVFGRPEGKLNATDQIEAENYTSATDVSLYEDCSDANVDYVETLSSNAVLEYDAVDFGSGVDTVTLRVSSIYTGAPLDVDLRLDSDYATPFVTVQVGQTGIGSCDFYITTVFLITRPVAVHNLFLTFPSAPGGYLHLDWFQFNQTVD